MKTLLVVLLLVAAVFSLNVRFSEMPENYQLYPRNDNDRADVVIRGTVLEPGKDSVVIVMTRNQSPILRQRTELSYQGDSANFEFTFSILAELAEYAFECRVNTELAAAADSVVAGDAYIIDGQSNACTIGGMSEWLEYHRMFGQDSTWTFGRSGVWGQKVANQIIQNHQIPVCILQGAIPGSAIGSHQRNNTNPYDGYYGAILLRAHLGKIQNGIKGIFWYQGEWDANYGSLTYYGPAFDQLWNSWMLDYPNVKKVYLVQVNTWQSDGAREVREVQRRLAHQYSNVEIMSAIGPSDYNGHYGRPGYHDLGARLYRLVSRDFYGSRDTAGIMPPEIQRAYYTSGARNRIALEFDQPVFWNAAKDSVVYTRDDGIRVPGQLKDYFAMNDSVWESVDSCWFELGSRRIVLALPDGVRPSMISYLPDWYNLRGCDAMSGPVLWNALQVSALTFARFPVENPAVYDTGAITAFRLEASKQTLSLFEALPLFGIADYASGAADTNHYVTFFSMDTFVARVDASGMLRGLNAGTVQAVAVKGGYKDTLVFTVGSGVAPMKSMAFKPAERTLMNGASMAVSLVGDFSDVSHEGLFRLDTVASFTYDAGVVRVEKGLITAVGTSSGTAVVASLAGQRCTLTVKVQAVPSYIRRINFQPKGMAITSLPGWSIDSGSAYSSGTGYGWMMTDYLRSDSYPLIDNYFRATWIWQEYPDADGERKYRIDCPDGNYLIRLCSGSWLWAEPGMVRMGNDTLIINRNGHDAFGSVTDQQISLADVKITVTGGQGLMLDIYSGICYIVLVSDDGAELNAVAQDSRTDAYSEHFTAKETGLNDKFALLRRPTACPNPFNPVTTVRFSLPAGVSADYVLYDIRGKRILSEKLKQASSPRMSAVTLDFNRSNNRVFASGTYFGRLVCSDGKRYVHTLVLIK